MNELINQAMRDLTEKLAKQIHEAKKERDDSEAQLSHVVEKLAPLLRAQQQYTGQIDACKRLIEKLEQQRAKVQDYLHANSQKREDA